MRIILDFIVTCQVLLTLGIQAQKTDTLKLDQANTILPYFIIDGHTHDLVPRNGSGPVQSELTELSKAGVNGVVLTFPLNKTNPDKLISQIKRDIEYVHSYAKNKSIKISFVNSYSNNPNDKIFNTVQILPSVEYFDGLFNGSTTRLDELKQLGIRSITLVNNQKDNISDDGRSLNKLGKELVKQLNDLNIAIDISHLPELVQFEVIKTSVKPVFASHSNCKAIVPCDRNLSDRVISELTKKRGMVLLTFDSEYLSGNSSLNGMDELIKHIDYLKTKFGEKCIGLGSDFGGSGANAPKELSTIESFNRIAQKLEEIGYSSETINGIMGNNIVDFFSEN